MEVMLLENLNVSMSILPSEEMVVFSNINTNVNQEILLMFESLIQRYY